MARAFCSTLLTLALLSLPARGIEAACARDLQVTATPQEKLAFIEAAVADQLFAVNKSNKLKLLGLMKDWNIPDSLSYVRLYRVVDAMFETSSWGVAGPGKLARRRWLTEVATRAAFRELQRRNLFPLTEAAEPEARLRRLARGIVHALLFRLPVFEPTRTPRARAELGMLVEARTSLGDEAAFAIYARDSRGRATVEASWNVVRSLAQSAMLGAFAWGVAVEVDRRIFPIEGLWISRQVVVREMSARAADEYARRFHQTMSPDLKNYLEVRFDKESLRGLLFERRRALHSDQK